MADITVTAAQVAATFPEQAEIYSGVAGVTITAGQAVYQAATGKLALSDASGAGTALIMGVALNGGGSGQGIAVLKRGHVAGFAVSGLDPHDALYLSDTAGALADAAGTVSVVVGKVLALSDANATDLAYIEV